MMTLDDRRKRLREWLKIIRVDVQDIIVDNHMFWEIQDMFRRNARLRDTPSNFNKWMASNFTQSITVSIRRLVDHDDRSVSLCRFLTEIQKFPDLLSRDAVAKNYRESSTSLPDDVVSDLASGDYDRYIGVGRVRPPSEMIQGELDELMQGTLAIKHYVDRRTAHYDQRGVTMEVPTFDDIDRCLALLEKFIKKYEILLNGAGYDQLMPTFLYDWKAIFEFPWDDGTAMSKSVIL